MIALHCRTFLHCISWIALSLFIVATASVAVAVEVEDDAEWIWAAAGAEKRAPSGTVYFRKSFRIAEPEAATVEITADDEYELYVNGHQVGAGHDWESLDEYDITRWLRKGRNTVAVQATNAKPGPAGLVARVLVKPKGGTFISYSTDGSWLASLRPQRRWNQAQAKESEWQAVASLGRLGATDPWGAETGAASSGGRFRVMKGFRIHWVVDPEKTGSLIAMTFNEFGQILAAREDGPLLLIRDSDGDDIPDEVTTYCDRVKNCQGILALNGSVLVTADGPEGAALYHLSDHDVDGSVDEVTPLVQFEGKMGEHGPHGLQLGPEGLVYVMCGNHTVVKRTFEAASPLREYFEGDLIQPRYEDPGGHATGIAMPAGCVLRVDPTGSTVELYAGGLRNAYKLAFNRLGDVFTVDSDMESDRGLSWYRPVRLCHILSGSDFGWRSGWAKLPNYYPDTLPTTLAMGPGSPTGMVFYDHVSYPERFRDTMFVCDWSLGRIVAVHLQPSGSSYVAKSEVFLEGRPLNATDIDVGPDGLIYFCTGGRKTEGGIYCVQWSEAASNSDENLGEGIERAIRQPQLHSAWSRQRIAEIQQQLDREWQPGLERIANNPRRSVKDRLRAVDLMQLLGPFPTTQQLLKLSRDTQPAIQAKAAYLMGIHTSSSGSSRLRELAGDSDPLVRRHALEALLRAEETADVDELLKIVADSDPHLSLPARRLLERVPIEQWRERVLLSDDTETFIRGSIALLTVNGSTRTGEEIVNRAAAWMVGEVSDPDEESGFISDENFTDLLRVVQLALYRGEIPPERAEKLRDLVSQEYPSRDSSINRELIRLLVYLQDTSCIPRMLIQIEDSEVADVDKLHLALHAGLIKSGWTTDEKMALLQFYEDARRNKGGKNVARYIDNVSREFFSHLTEEQRSLVLEGGAKWPHSALAALAKLPAQPGSATTTQLLQLDAELAGSKEEAAKRLRTGIVAVLGRSRSARGMAYLRKLYAQEPERRPEIAVGLSQEPEGANWSILVRALPILEDRFAAIVLEKLNTVNRRPLQPEPYRQVILCGLAGGDQTANRAIDLLETWTGESLSEPQEQGQTALSAWQNWFHQRHPQSPRAELPVEAEGAQWSFDELLTFLKSTAGHEGHAVHGAAVYERAQCAKCHRFGSRGTNVGPDLSHVSRRFQRKEILQSILFPNHVISDQYSSKTVHTNDGRAFTGIVTPDLEDGVHILVSSGETVRILQDEIDEIVASPHSAMPAGLLDTLSREDVADLFAYLAEPPRTDVTSRRGTTTPK